LIFDRLHIGKKISTGAGLFFENYYRIHWDVIQYIVVSLHPNSHNAVMLELKGFILPIKGLANDQYEWNFILGSDFFEDRENSPIKDAQLEVTVKLYRRATLLVFDFEIGGFVNCRCDRCTAKINLPVTGEYRLMVKMTWDEEISEQNDEIIYIDPDVPQLDLSDHLYEFACLSLPISKTYDCGEEDPQPCNLEVLEKLEDVQPDSENDTEMDGIWEQIKRELQ